MRLRSTESQAGLTFRQRRLNVRGAFTVSDPTAVTMKHVLLIDDILTTGATARAAAQALARAGAASVWVATLARAHSTVKARGGFAASFDEAEEQPGIAPVRSRQQASIHSSQDQSSF
jgi:predicted phosphoribosyltransferase